MEEGGGRASHRSSKLGDRSLAWVMLLGMSCVHSIDIVLIILSLSKSSKLLRSGNSTVSSRRTGPAGRDA